MKTAIFEVQALFNDQATPGLLKLSETLKSVAKEAEQLSKVLGQIAKIDKKSEEKAKERRTLYNQLRDEYSQAQAFLRALANPIKTIGDLFRPKAEKEMRERQARELRNLLDETKKQGLSADERLEKMKDMQRRHQAEMDAYQASRPINKLRKSLIDDWNALRNGTFQGRRNTLDKIRDATLSALKDPSSRINTMFNRVADGFQGWRERIASDLRSSSKRATEQAWGNLTARLSENIGSSFMDGLFMPLRATFEAGFNMLRGIAEQFFANFREQWQRGIEIESKDVMTASAIAKELYGGLDDAAYEKGLSLLNRAKVRLDKLASSLPGSTDDYLRLMAGTFDNIAPALRGRSDDEVLDLVDRMFSTAGALGAANQVAVGQVQQWLSKALAGASTAQLKKLEFAMSSPTLNAAIDKIIGDKKLNQLSIQERFKLLLETLEEALPPQVLARVSETFDGAWQGFLTQFKGLMGFFGQERFVEVRGIRTTVNEQLRKLLQKPVEMAGSILQKLRGTILDPMQGMAWLFSQINRFAQPAFRRYATLIPQRIREVLEELRKSFSSGKIDRFYKSIDKLVHSIFGLIYDFFYPLNRVLTSGAIADVFTVIFNTITTLLGIPTHLGDVTSEVGLGFELVKEQVLLFFENIINGFIIAWERLGPEGQEKVINAINKAINGVINAIKGLLGLGFRIAMVKVAMAIANMVPAFVSLLMTTFLMGLAKQILAALILAIPAGKLFIGLIIGGLLFLGYEILRHTINWINQVTANWGIIGAALRTIMWLVVAILVFAVIKSLAMALAALVKASGLWASIVAVAGTLKAIFLGIAGVVGALAKGLLVLIMPVLKIVAIIAGVLFVIKVIADLLSGKNLGEAISNAGKMLWDGVMTFFSWLNPMNWVKQTRQNNWMQFSLPEPRLPDFGGMAQSYLLSQLPSMPQDIDIRHLIPQAEGQSPGRHVALTSSQAWREHVGSQEIIEWLRKQNITGEKLDAIASASEHYGMDLTALQEHLKRIDLSVGTEQIVEYLATRRGNLAQDFAVTQDGMFLSRSGPHMAFNAADFRQYQEVMEELGALKVLKSPTADQRKRITELEQQANRLVAVQQQFVNSMADRMLDWDAMVSGRQITGLVSRDTMHARRQEALTVLEGGPTNAAALARRLHEVEAERSRFLNRAAIATAPERDRMLGSQQFRNIQDEINYITKRLSSASEHLTEMQKQLEEQRSRRARQMQLAETAAANRKLLEEFRKSFVAFRGTEEQRRQLISQLPTQFQQQIERLVKDRNISQLEALDIVIQQAIAKAESEKKILTDLERAITGNEEAIRALQEWLSRNAEPEKTEQPEASTAITELFGSGTKDFVLPELNLETAKLPALQQQLAVVQEHRQALLAQASTGVERMLLERQEGYQKLVAEEARIRQYLAAREAQIGDIDTTIEYLSKQNKVLESRLEMLNLTTPVEALGRMVLAATELQKQGATDEQISEGFMQAPAIYSAISAKAMMDNTSFLEAAQALYQQIEAKHTEISQQIAANQERITRAVEIRETLGGDISKLASTLSSGASSVGSATNALAGQLNSGAVAVSSAVANIRAAAAGIPAPQAAATGYRGHFPKIKNAYVGMNLSSLYEAATREIRAMPAGSSLIMANSSETILNQAQARTLATNIGTLASARGGSTSMTVNITINGTDTTSAKELADRVIAEIDSRYRMLMEEQWV